MKRKRKEQYYLLSKQWRASLAGGGGQTHLAPRSASEAQVAGAGQAGSHAASPHSAPVHPAGHSQVHHPAPPTHRPPLRQGVEAQPSTARSHLVPVHPSRHTHAQPDGTAAWIQEPPCAQAQLVVGGGANGAIGEGTVGGASGTIGVSHDGPAHPAGQAHLQTPGSLIQVPPLAQSPSQRSRSSRRKEQVSPAIYAKI